MEREEKEIILISGPPGCDRNPYIKDAIKDKDTDTEYYHVFEYIQDVGRRKGFNITEINISTIPGIEEIRKDAFETIKREIEESDKQYHIVSTPAIFYHSDWRKEEGLTEDLFCILKPNVIIVFIDDLIEMKKRLSQHERWRLEFGDKGPQLSFLAKWRQDSVEFLHDMYTKYHFMRENGFVKEFYIFAKQHPKETFLDLIYKRFEKPKIYLSYPITKAREKEKLDRVKNFRDKLSEHFIVFDPYTIRDWNIVLEYDRAKKEGREEIYIDSEVISIHEIESAIDSIRTQIIDRDFSIIRSVDAVVVYHHTEEVSAGVVAEVVYAKQILKPIFGIYPFRSRPSPFLEYFIRWKNIPTLYTPEKLTDINNSISPEEILQKLEELIIEELTKIKDHILIYRKF